MAKYSKYNFLKKIYIIGTRYLITETKPNYYKTGTWCLKTKPGYIDTKPKLLEFDRGGFHEYPTR